MGRHCRQDGRNRARRVLNIPDEPDIDYYYSIDGLFELITEAIDSGPERVTLGFDSAFGYPTLVIIEFAPGNDHGDVSFSATQLVQIPGPPDLSDTFR